MLKLIFLYRVRNLVSGRVFYGIHSSPDISFANPICRISDLCRVPVSHASGSVAVAGEYDTLPNWNNKSLAKDIKSLGEQNFTIEAIYSSALREDVDKIFKQYVTEAFVKSDLAYNKPLAAHRVTSEDNPMYNDETKKKMSEIIKSKKIIRDSNGRIMKIVPKDQCVECNLIAAHKLSCSMRYQTCND